MVGFGRAGNRPELEGRRIADRAPVVVLRSTLKLHPVVAGADIRAAGSLEAEGSLVKELASRTGSEDMGYTVGCTNCKGPTLWWLSV
jgi:hypothetical protein